MMGVKDKIDRSQIELLSLDDLVPKNHLVRKLEKAINLDFIYDEVRERQIYSKIYLLMLPILLMIKTILY